mmetsp:Transcript_6374/g.10493  ORF Transcript_6374/g.10493 Transcript_6374/m.10493 type:complete len:470 (+) Transcript_6374:143-1552(+)
MDTQGISSPQYALKVDPAQGDRATEIKVCSFAKPHMRAFHFAWLGFFVAFLAWFSFAPLMPKIKEDIGLTADEIWVANICSVASTIVFRFAIGPLCDRFGGRLCMALILCTFCIPVAVGGFVVNNGTDLAIVRFFQGVIGCVFVPCQFWTAQMFARNVVGGAQALTGGWGNLGGGVTQIFMVAVYSAMKASFDGEMAWRASFLIPALVIFLAGVSMAIFGQDCPKGQYKTLQATGQMATTNPGSAFKQAVKSSDAWVLHIQYACCFGIELTINNMVVSYFYNEFGLGLETAGTIGSLFGLMNLFARATGGIISDFVNKHMSGLNKSHPLRARVVAHSIILFYEGLMLIAFSRCTNLGAAIVVLVLFSMGVQMAEGTSFSIVPYVDPPVTGAISGIVGAGGNVGAVCWGMTFLYGPEKDQTVLLILGFIVMASSLMSVFLRLENAKQTLGQQAKEIAQEEGKNDAAAADA